MKKIVSEKIKMEVLAIGLVALSLPGCVINTPSPDDPYYQPAMPRTESNNYSYGSLYVAQNTTSLYEDYKARRVGDLLTIILSENTETSVEMDTDLNKKTDISLSNPTILGSTPQFNAPGILPLQSNKDNTLQIGINGDNKFSGDSQSKQKNKLTGTISVTVVQVLPNNNLVVRGEKWLNLSQGKEFIRIAGIVRPEDIDGNNRVRSSQLADARISYSGSGTLASATTPGWLSKIVTSSFWPF